MAKARTRVNRPWSSDNYIVCKEDKVVLKGTIKDICSKLDVTPSCIYYAVKDNRLVRRRYRIYYMGEYDN